MKKKLEFLAKSQASLGVYAWMAPGQIATVRPKRFGRGEHKGWSVEAVSLSCCSGLRGTCAGRLVTSQRSVSKLPLMAIFAILIAMASNLIRELGQC